MLIQSRILVNISDYRSFFNFVPDQRWRVLINEFLKKTSNNYFSLLNPDLRFLVRCDKCRSPKNRDFARGGLKISTQIVYFSCKSCGGGVAGAHEIFFLWSKYSIWNFFVSKKGRLRVSSSFPVISSHFQPFSRSQTLRSYPRGFAVYEPNP